MDTALKAAQGAVNPVQVVPRLRPDLVFRPQTFGGRSYFIVEDPLNGRFFRVGVAEYTLLSGLQGDATLADVLQATRRAWPDCSFTLREAADICAWAMSSGLAQPAGSSGRLAPNVPPVQVAARRAGGWWTPVSLQVPLVHPDRWVE
ncbi:MAG: hypothetical protein MUF48_08265, partial [Pirellulaceae bacterium]|nr:hypothetical protein [Pirellulaceae bacterium]